LTAYVYPRIYEVMATAKVFRSGNSQAVRLPRDVRFPAHVREVRVTRRGDELVLSPAVAEHFDVAFWEVLGSMPGFRRPRQRRQRRSRLFP
jgi:antitoxin VapB